MATKTKKISSLRSASIKRESAKLSSDKNSRIALQARSGKKAIAAYSRETGKRPYDAVYCLLSDLMHVCDHYPELGRFLDALEDAQWLYDQERANRGA